MQIQDGMDGPMKHETSAMCRTSRGVIQSNSIKELVKGLPRNSLINMMTLKNQSYRLWWGAADQYTMSHGTYIHITT